MILFLSSLGQLIWFFLKSRRFSWCQRPEIDDVWSQAQYFDVKQISLTLGLDNVKQHQMSWPIVSWYYSIQDCRKSLAGWVAISALLTCWESALKINELNPLVVNPFSSAKPLFCFNWCKSTTLHHVACFGPYYEPTPNQSYRWVCCCW